MTFKLKTIFPGLIFILFASILWAAEPIIPLPPDASKVWEESDNLGPMKSTDKMYESSLNKNKLASFYKKELSGAGWVENEEWVFTKDKNMVIITISPEKNAAGKTDFVISTSGIPTTEEILAMRKKNPDKLNFMPVYPGSEQVYLWDLSNGIMGLYETENSIKDVVFFYKSGMLNYGWSLASQTPITSGAIDSIDCPECKKITQGLGVDKSNNVSTSSQATLIFRKGANETCKIIIVNTSVDMGNLPPSSKTTISVLYNVYKKIR